MDAQERRYKRLYAAGAWTCTGSTSVARGQESVATARERRYKRLDAAVLVFSDFHLIHFVIMKFVDEAYIRVEAGKGMSDEPSAMQQALSAARTGSAPPGASEPDAPPPDIDNVLDYVAWAHNNPDAAKRVKQR